MHDHIKISLVIDGVDLFKDWSHFSAGIKIPDPWGVHPVTKKPLFVQAEDGEEKMVKKQSSEMCCILMIVLMIVDAKDKRDLYEDVFWEFYEWGAWIWAYGLPASNGNPALLPFALVLTTNLIA
jgi:hypothetical protein